MRRAVIAAAVLLAAPAWPWVTPRQSGESPLEFPAGALIEKDMIQPDALSTFVVPYRNASDAYLAISVRASSCACHRTSLTPALLPPRAQGELVITTKSPARGDITGWVVVHAAHADVPSDSGHDVPVQFRATVSPPVGVSIAPSVIELPSSELQASTEVTVDVHLVAPPGGRIARIDGNQLRVEPATVRVLRVLEVRQPVEREAMMRAQLVLGSDAATLDTIRCAIEGYEGSATMRITRR